MKHNKAFTLLEMVVVIVVIGIIIAMAMPRMERDTRQNAANHLLSAIQYTKHLALLDNKTLTLGNFTRWQKELWAIRFTVGTDYQNTYYTIGTDDNNNSSISKNEAAIDPANGKYLYNSSGAFASIAVDESPNIFIGHNYGIDNIVFSGGCSNAQHIAFDHLGRPYNGIGTATNNFATYMQSDCKITFEFVDDTIDDIEIMIEKQTGYAYIKN